MNKNLKNYKEAINEIKAPEDLKKKTLENMKETKRKIPYLKILSACAVFVFVFGISYLNYEKKDEQAPVNNSNTKQIAKIENLNTFKDMDELEQYFKENSKTRSGLNEDSDISFSAETKGTNQSVLESADTNTNTSSNNNDYSKTNTQTEGVDESDIIKTDGKYIYFISSYNESIEIIDSENLNIVSKLEDFKDENIYPKEMYLINNKLIVIGEKYKNSYLYKRYYTSNTNYCVALVFDLSNIEKPEFTRKVEIEGNYISSRMVNNNLYFITDLYKYFYEDCKTIDLIPTYQDTVKSETSKNVDLNSIYCFPDTKSTSYVNIVSFNVEKEKEANVKTFLGASSDIYSSIENLYLTQNEYNYNYDNVINQEKTLTKIYKFKLKDGDVEYVANGEVDGNILNQFSMDEYNGNLRIATTKYGVFDNKINNVYILDENLEEIGKTENLAFGEEIYSVRFIGKIGYVVTFKEVDPLFVIDLSDPNNPEVKGKLKIPGYSSYLHPYDETHIIGIGRNTEETKYGSTVNTNMKMSMFDVSDLENPTELFSVSIGEKGTTSSILYNHKALFFNKEKDLIGFPISYNNSSDSNSYYKFINGAIIYKIDIENKKFEEKGILGEIDSYENIQRIIYIKDKLYALSNNSIVQYNLETLEKIKETKF